MAVDPADVAACVGTKEFVASVAHYLHLAGPDRDTVLYPAVSYPTYAMGATLAGCRAVPVPPPTADGSGLDLDAVDPADTARALLVWANSPANPSGGLSDLGAAAAWGRAHGVPVFSDECYTEFTWDGPPRSILQSGIDGVVAVHSLSKRSNMAGVRAGFYAGDPELVRYLRGVRQHAGLMVPGPGAGRRGGGPGRRRPCGQSAPALPRAAHLHGRRPQRRRLPGRPARRWLLPVGAGPRGLARRLGHGGGPGPAGGLLVSPGELYGPAGRDHVRVAMVQPMVRLRLVTERLATAGWRVPGG